MISSVPVKDRTVVGVSDKIERMPITQLAEYVSTLKPSSSTQAGPCSVSVRTLDGSKDVWGARHEPTGRSGLNVLVSGCP